MEETKVVGAKLTKKEAITQEVINAVIPEKTLADSVFARVTSLEKGGGIDFPVGYSYANALRSAWLMLQQMQDKDKKPVLAVCSKESVANALLDMVIQGLSPVKKQCYFIAYGGVLQMQRSYMGTAAVTKRLKGVKDVIGVVIWEGDDFEFTIDPETFAKKIIKHNTKFENINIGKIKGAYGVVLRTDLPPLIEIMSLDQIKKAWDQGYARGKSGAHTNFTDEMCKKTVISRTCKMLFNTSDDSDVLVESVNNTLDEIDDTAYELAIEEEIKGNANKEEVDFEKVKALTQPPAAETGKKDVVDEKKVATSEKEPALAGPGF